jgi:hypothetical protein
MHGVAGERHATAPRSPINRFCFHGAHDGRS